MILPGTQKPPPPIGNLYAGASSKTSKVHLSYLPSTNTDRRGLCGQRTLITEERIIRNYKQLDELVATRKLCSGCARSAPWQTIARS